MSYDLMVFCPEPPLLDRKSFMGWYDRQIEWSEDIDYESVETCKSPALRLWFFEIIQDYPPLNGFYASNDLDNSRVTDYSKLKRI